MLHRLARGILIAAFAAFGVFSIGGTLVTILAVAAIPVAAAIVDVLIAEVFGAMTLLAIACVVWAYTPMGDFIKSKAQELRKSSINNGDAGSIGDGSNSDYAFERNAGHYSRS
jgi:hypothetical protein